MKSLTVVLALMAATILVGCNETEPPLPAIGVGSMGAAKRLVQQVMISDGPASAGLPWSDPVGVVQGNIATFTAEYRVFANGERRACTFELTRSSSSAEFGWTVKSKVCRLIEERPAPGGTQ